jgi:putative PIN family toxin of toxin-antitoxin system
VRVLLDTNVLVSAVLFGGLPRQLLDAALQGRFVLVTGVELLDEFEDVLRSRFGFDRSTARLVRAEMDSAAELAQPRDLPPVSRDPDDDLVLATAQAGAAAVIVTGDKDLLVLEAHQGVPILTPRQFAERFSAGGYQP